MKQKRILVCPIEAVGHVNACRGAMLPLLERGHRIAFFIDVTFRGQLAKFGFEEFEFESNMNKGTKNPGDGLAQMLIQYGILGNIDIESQCRSIFRSPMNHDDSRKNFQETDKVLRKVIETFQPDLLVVDNISLLPAIANSGRPWVRLISTNPLFYLQDEGGFDHLPPCWTGFGPDQDRDRWPMFRKLARELAYSAAMNDLLEEMGYPRYPNNRTFSQTQALTVYAMPEEYEYPEIGRHKPDWFNLDVFDKNAGQETVDLKSLLPADFLADQLDGQFSGKWIYVSLGSMGSIDLDLVRRLIGALAKTPHKYIVSKGPRHAEYELPRNMWGDRYLPQTKIVPLMDAVITHGGNNTVTETFAQGVPMVVMPLFADQHDNAQRLEQIGLAVRIKPYDFEPKQLASSLEQLVSDQQLKQRLLHASERIRTSNKHEILCDKIESILLDKNSEP